MLNEQEEHQYAMFTHLAALGMFIIPFGNVIGPLIVWLIKKDVSQLVHENGVSAINFQITYTIITIIVIGPLYVITFGSLFWTILSHPSGNPEFGLDDFPFYLPSFILLFISIFILFGFQLYFIIKGALKANKGEVYQYPFSFSFIKP